MRARMTRRTPPAPARAGGGPAIVAAVAVLLASSAGACQRDRQALAAPLPKLTLGVPRVAGPVVIDAELEGKRLWEGDPGATGNFKDQAGHGIVPYTEAKARWGNGKLYLMLYAGDLDLEGSVRAHDGPVEDDDAFHIELGAGDETRVVSVSVLGTVADALCHGAGASRRCDAGWESQAEVAVDRDGTLNKLGDNDEEWVIEMALPLAALGVANATPGTRLPFSVRRCEMARAGRRACGGWGVEPRGELVFQP
jgi:hypothetical protein